MTKTSDNLHPDSERVGHRSNAANRHGSARRRYLWQDANRSISSSCESLLFFESRWFFLQRSDHFGANSCAFLSPTQFLQNRYRIDDFNKGKFSGRSQCVSDEFRRSDCLRMCEEKFVQSNHQQGDSVSAQTWLVFHFSKPWNPRTLFPSYFHHFRLSNSLMIGLFDIIIWIWYSSIFLRL